MNLQILIDVLAENYFSTGNFKLKSNRINHSALFKIRISKNNDKGLPLRYKSESGKIFV